MFKFRFFKKNPPKQKSNREDREIVKTQKAKSPLLPASNFDRSSFSPQVSSSHSPASTTNSPDSKVKKRTKSSSPFFTLLESPKPIRTLVIPTDQFEALLAKNYTLLNIGLDQPKKFSATVPIFCEFLNFAFRLSFPKICNQASSFIELTQNWFDKKKETMKQAPEDLKCRFTPVDKEQNQKSQREMDKLEFISGLLTAIFRFFQQDWEVVHQMYRVFRNKLFKDIRFVKELKHYFLGMIHWKSHTGHHHPEKAIRYFFDKEYQQNETLYYSDDHSNSCRVTYRQPHQIFPYLWLIRGFFRSSISNNMVETISTCYHSVSIS